MLSTLKDVSIALSGARLLSTECRDPWIEAYSIEKSCIVPFVRGNTRINVHYNSSTVEAVLSSPTQARLHLYRTEVRIPTLYRLFETPGIYIEGEGKTLTEKIEAIDEEIEVHKQCRFELARSVDELRTPRKEKEADRKMRKKQEKKSNHRTPRERRINEEHNKNGRKMEVYFSGLHGFFRNINLNEAIYIVAHPDFPMALFTMRDGKSYWEGQGMVPKRVDEKLRHRSGECHRPIAVSFGTHGRYFLQFANGEEYWRGVPSLKMQSP